MHLIATVFVALVGLSGAPTAQHDAAAARDGGGGKVALKLAPSDYGRIVVDRSGRALYLFTREGSSKPRCYRACAGAWPPALFGGRPRAGKGLRDDLVGTTRRRGGSRQLTYAGHPLYRYVGDTAPGVVNCQAAYEYGGGWFVVGKNGTAIR